MTDPWLWRLRVTTAVFWVGSGTSRLLGPSAWRSSSAYDVIQWFMPLRAWAVMFMVIGLLIAAPLINDRLPHDGPLVIGVAVAVLWLAGFVTAGLLNKLSGSDGPWLWLLVAGVHLYQAGLPLPHRNK